MVDVKGLESPVQPSDVSTFTPTLSYERLAHPTFDGRNFGFFLQFFAPMFG